MNITVDTCVLYSAYCELEPSALRFISEVAMNCAARVNLDHDGCIGQEYARLNAERGYQKWFKHIVGRNGFERVDGRLSRKVKQDLLERGFHEPTDHVFVATALNSDRLLCTEDSDYGCGSSPRAQQHSAVFSYLGSLGLDVRDSKAALQWFMPDVPFEPPTPPTT